MDKAQVIEPLKAAFMMLEGAEKSLNLKRGEGYAEAHPEIVAAFMLSIALNCHAQQVCEFRSKLDTHSTANWTAIPEQTGH